MEWPRGSGRLAEFPEVDRIEWLPLDRAFAKIIPAQTPFLERLRRALADAGPGAIGALTSRLVRGLAVALVAVALLGSPRGDGQVPGRTPVSTTVTVTNVGNDDDDRLPRRVGLQRRCTWCTRPWSGAARQPRAQTHGQLGLADAHHPALSALAAGGSATYVITVQLDATATNADQGLTATIPLTWSITQ